MERPLGVERERMNNEGINVNTDTGVSSGVNDGGISVGNNGSGVNVGGDVGVGGNTGVDIGIDVSGGNQGSNTGTNANSDPIKTATQSQWADLINRVKNAGGSTYTAGDGIDITNDIIKATNTGKARVLTTADYNYPTSNPDSVALWLLDAGTYTITDSNVYVRISSDFGSRLAEGALATVSATDSTYNRKTIIVSSASSSPIQKSTINLSTGATFGTAESLITRVRDTLTSTEYRDALSANQGKVLKDLVDSLAFKNAGAPTTSTIGTVGQLIEDTTNGKLYICTDITGGSYTWEEVGAGGGGGSDIVEINYSDYNPTWAFGTNLTTNFGQWLRSKNVHPGQVVRIVNDGTPGHDYMYFYKGGTNEERTQVHRSLPYVVFYIVTDTTDSNGTYANFSIVSDLEGHGLVEWYWFINNDSDSWSFSERKFLTTEQISELGQSTSTGHILSANSGAELNTLLQIATNITGLSKVNVQSPLASKEVLTFDQTMDAWDFEWRYTMQLDSSSSYNLATASEGSQVYIYCRDTKGLPLVYTPQYTFENYELTDNSGNTVSVPMTRYSWDGTTNTGQPVIFSAQNLYLFKKFSDGWKCVGSANTPTFLPRTISA